MFYTTLWRSNLNDCFTTCAFGYIMITHFITKWRRRDSNSWPPACKAGALPTELHPHLDFYSIQRLSPMGLSGLEPPTSRLSGVRSNQLSYKPLLIGGHLLSHAVSSIVPSAA